MMDWVSAGWIILTGALVASSAALVGCFLILRRMALLGDAISHGVLPGIALAFLLTGSRSPLPMVIGAGALGLLLTMIVQALRKSGLQEDAGIGVSFTTLFASGVVIISLFASKIDLDLDCVLYGEIAYTPWNLLIVYGISLGPQPIWTMGIIFLITVLAITLLYKEFKICAFDPALAAALGINVSFIHFLLMGLVSLNTVGAFESVGAILVVAMMIAPGATAYLLTERLDRMLVLSVVQGVLSSILGYFLARAFDSSIAAAMTVVSGSFFALALFFAPQRGIVAKAWLQYNQRRRAADRSAVMVADMVTD